MKSDKQLFKIKPLHPSDKDLADFIDDNLSTEEREETIRHMVFCDKCIKIVSLVKQNRNKIYYKKAFNKKI